jgi:hypothetical protein
MSQEHPAVVVARRNPDIFPKKFLRWLPGNLPVWEAFVKHSLAHIEQGGGHYSARAILYVIRYNNPATKTRMSDHYSPYMARLFDLIYPQHVGLWSYRPTKLTLRQKLNNLMGDLFDGLGE